MRSLTPLVLVAILVGACSGDEAVRSGPRREHLQILAHSPEFEGPLPFEHVRRTEWDDAVVHADGQTVTLRYLGGNTYCFGPDRVEALYDDERIVLTLFYGVITLGPREACTLEGRPGSLTIRLSEPVAGRELVDGANGVRFGRSP